MTSATSLFQLLLSPLLSRSAMGFFLLLFFLCAVLFFKSRGRSAFYRAAPWLKENLMNPNIDFLGICQLLKALRTVGFSENEIKKIARRIAVELGANFTLYA